MEVMKKTVFILAAMITGISYAEPKMTMGYGAISCGDYVKQPQSRTYRDAWVTGFLSGLNEMGKVDILIPDGVTPNAISEATFLFCKNNPLENMDAAVHSVYYQLLRKYSPK